MRAYREARIDLGAVAENVAALKKHVGTQHTMAVVKANGYGHGAVRVARAAVAGGADWLGVADIAEALELRSAGIAEPILAWLHDPRADYAAAITASVSLGISAGVQLHAVADAARRTGVTADVHLKVDTGLSRNGIPRAEWEALLAAARALETEGVLTVGGIFSHLANASEVDDAAQATAFDDAIAAAESAGLAVPLRHLASTAAALARPEMRHTMVRLGIGVYGLSPWGADRPLPVELRPAMTLRASIAHVRRVSTGAGASYDYTWRASHETTLALVPLGYADGVPRQASGRAEVTISGDRCAVVGRVAMDQFIVDVGDLPVAIGDEVVLFGDPAYGVPSADDWAAAADTINYDIVTRVGSRVERVYE